MASKNYTDLSMRKAAPAKGMFRSALDRVIEARERQVRHYVRQNLAMHGRDLDDMIRGGPHDAHAPRR